MIIVKCIKFVVYLQQNQNDFYHQRSSEELASFNSWSLRLSRIRLKLKGEQNSDPNTAKYIY